MRSLTSITWYFPSRNDANVYDAGREIFPISLDDPTAWNIFAKSPTHFQSSAARFTIHNFDFFAINIFIWRRSDDISWHSIERKPQVVSLLLRSAHTMQLQAVECCATARSRHYDLSPPSASFRAQVSNFNCNLFRWNSARMGDCISPYRTCTEGYQRSHPLNSMFNFLREFPTIKVLFNFHRHHGDI